MASSEKKKTPARACESCTRKRGQRSCLTDDTFFCKFCDDLVQYSDPFPYGYERVRQAGHQGFRKKPRTPREKNSKKQETSMMSFNPLHVVPEIESDEPNTMSSNEQHCYQVPVFDIFSGEQIPSDATHTETEDPFDLKSMNGLILPSDLELAEFEADMEALGMLDCGLNNLVKVEDENYEAICDEHMDIHGKSKKSMKMLKLDYDGIIAGWDDDRSPWTTGKRPELDPDDCWLGCTDSHDRCCSGDMGTMMRPRLDVDREARVTRYREKRQTRLFSKKIRYEVRKLNAEKRPRMKGRFVKRTSFAA
ncbi:hypothetical protein L1987_61750 [Smallanthus sonchifolius]|uniref:Uncharacterized protein n=1 Tax=Smallanthus sonchifolius TaxID=185202 RepID=A0ACB9C8H4_9ASTR|nr:hypothetical protein L1987_61750 [Smallanthus sonchifolius]